MRLDAPLDDVFRGRSAVRVLRALYALPVGFSVSTRELARRAGVSHPTASNVLGNLADRGIVVRRRVPRADLFELDRRNVLTDRMSPLFEWESQLRSELVSFLRDQLRRDAPSVRAAFLFGSAAREEAAAVGDVDLAVISTPGRTDEAQTALERVSDAVRERFGTPVNVLIGTHELDAAGKLRGAETGVWRHIASEGIPLLSPRDNRSRRG